MISLTAFEDKSVAVFGLGSSGLATANSLTAGGAEVLAFDDNPDSVDEANAQGIETYDFRRTDFSVFDYLILAPGVPLTHPVPHWSVDLAHSAEIPIIGDIELFTIERAKVAPSSTLVAITGTNGKSTTTALVAHMLQDAGRRVEMGGNIGRAVLEFDPLNNDTIYVVECSSYQIDLAPSLAPEIGVLLNLSPDHLDRHGTMEDYVAVKQRLVAASTNAIVSVDDEYCIDVATDLEMDGIELTKISVNGALDFGVYMHGDAIISSDHSGNVQVADIGGIGGLRGRHNAQNACVSWRVGNICGLDNEQIQAGFENFPGLAHRMEELGRIGNVLIVNDSKGTNADAADMALGSFENIYWIAGGRAKEGGIEPLRHHFGKIAKAYLIGEAAQNFSETLEDEVEFELCGTLDVALEAALVDAKKDGGDEPVILMSPACASFDQFPSYDIRGESFRELVEAQNGFEPTGKIVSKPWEKN